MQEIQWEESEQIPFLIMRNHWEIKPSPVRVLLLTASCASTLDAGQVSMVGRAYRYLHCHPHNHFWTKNHNTILRKLLIKVEFQMWYVDLTFMLMFSFCILAFKIICSVPCVTPASSQQYTLNLRRHTEREKSIWRKCELLFWQNTR